MMLDNEIWQERPNNPTEYIIYPIKNRDSKTHRRKLGSWKTVNASIDYSYVPIPVTTKRHLIQSVTTNAENPTLN
jgi:hypothetical protein